MPALNALNELRTKLGLVFEVIGEPILKLEGLFGREPPYFSFDGFKLAHGGSLPLVPREVKAQTGKGNTAASPDFQDLQRCLGSRGRSPHDR